MLGFIFCASLAIISEVTCSPKISVYTTSYEKEFKKLENQTCPYDSVDNSHPKLRNIVFLIVGLNDYTGITENKSLKEEYRDLEDNIKYNHKAQLVLLGCSDIGLQDLHLVDDFIKKIDERKIRTFGYGIFNTNYTMNTQLWDDDDIDLLLDEFMRIFHGDNHKRIYSPNEFITIFDANPPLRRLESYLMNTKNGRFESKIIVTFILIGGDKMDEFLSNEKHENLLLNIAANEFDRFELVFLMGCYNFRTNFHLIADVIENQKALLVENYRGPMKNESIHVHVQGRGIWSSDFVFKNNSKENLISNIDIREVDPFLDLYYKKTSKHTEYEVYDCQLQNIQQLGFQYINGEYRPHAAEETFEFDTSNADVLKIIFATKNQFENAYSANKSRLKQLLKNVQITRHKVYLIVCHAEISTYPNVITTMLENHLGNYLKKNIGEVWLNTPKTFGSIQRYGDGGQYKEWPFKPIDDILRK